MKQKLIPVLTQDRKAHLQRRQQLSLEKEEKKKTGTDYREFMNVRRQPTTLQQMTPQKLLSQTGSCASSLLPRNTESARFPRASFC